MKDSSNKPGILIVTTREKRSTENIGPSEKNFIKLLEPTFNVRVITARGDLEKPITEKGIILNGSTFSVLDDLDWMQQYYDFVEKMISESKLILGVCFGFQVLSKYFGGSIENISQPQVSYKQVQLTDEGKTHPLFRGLPRKMILPTYHFDHVAKLPNATTLATTDISPYYAAEFTKTTWGVQFHPEMSKERLLEKINKNKSKIPDWERRINEVENTIVKGHEKKILENFAEAVLSH